MKITVILRKTLIILFFIIGLNSCNNVDDLFEGINIIVDWDVIWSKLNINFKDAQTGEMIGGENFQQVSVKITGESIDYIVDISGVQKELYKSNKGFLTLGINPDQNSADAVRFNIVASAQGYLPMSQSITMSEQGDYNLTVFMANIENPPEGVSIKTTENTGLVINGILQTEVQVKTQGSEACIVLPNGLRMVDENGAWLEGTLDIRLVYYNNISDGSLSTFPGGLISRVEKYGSVLDGTFFPAGLVSIEIFDQYGKKARYFEQSALRLIMAIPSGTFNPETQSNVEAGDEIPIQSYDPETGIWKYHQTTPVSLGNRGDLEVESWIPHLSWWSFDWFKGNYCNNGIELIFKGDFGECSCITVDGIIRKKADDTFLRYISLNVCQDSSVYVTNAPTGLPVYIDWMLSGNCSNCFTDPAFNPLYIDDLCASNTIEVPLVCFTPNSTSVEIDVTGLCSEKPDLVVRPSFGAWYKESGSNCWKYSAMQNGLATICDVEEGLRYTVGTYYDNIWYDWEITIEEGQLYQLQFALTDNICSEFF